MLLRASISNTKKFFKKTVESIKSFLSGGYQRLPKTPPLNPFSCGNGVDTNLSQSYRELDKFYIDFTDQWDSDNDKAKEKKRSKKKLSSPVPNNEKEVCSGNFMKLSKQASPPPRKYQEERREDQKKKKKKRIVYEGKRKQDYFSRPKGRDFLVAQKLKELEMMDKSNVEHVLDIEEVRHYYSRLTCPAYLDIVDKFFMDMYADIFSLQASTRSNYSTPPLIRSVEYW